MATVTLFNEYNNTYYTVTCVLRSSVLKGGSGALEYFFYVSTDMLDMGGNPQTSYLVRSTADVPPGYSGPASDFTALFKMYIAYYLTNAGIVGSSSSSSLSSLSSLSSYSSLSSMSSESSESSTLSSYSSVSSVSSVSSLSSIVINSTSSDSSDSSIEINSTSSVSSDSSDSSIEINSTSSDSSLMHS